MIPQLRFPEFQDEWQIERLSEVTSKIQDGTHFSPVVSNDGEYLYVTSKNIKQGALDLSEVEYISKEEHRTIYKRCNVQNGDVLLTKDGASTGNTCINTLTEEFSLLSSVAFIRADSEKATNEFVYHLISSSKGQKEIAKSISGQAITRITLTKIRNYKFSFPTPPEQTKIANFLTAVDKRINRLQKKKAELERYKKGVMQKLFSQTIRFKDKYGNDFPDWEEKMLGDLGNTYNGLTGKTKVDFGIGKPYIQYMQIFSDSKIDTTKFGYVNIEEEENQKSAQYGDVFFTTSSETPNEIGTSSVLTEQVEEVYLNSFCFGYRPNSLDELVPEFSQFFFRSNHVRREIVKLAQGSTRFNMSKVELMKLKFYFPQKDEQTKIAEFLILVDKSIEALGNQIKDSAKFKQGLLQKMFV